MVCGGDDHAVGLILLDHLQETVEHPSNLAYIVSHSSLRANSIELVKKVDSTHIADSIKNLT